MAERSAAHPWTDLLRSRWNGFALWWLAGLRDTVPAAWRHRFLSATGPILIVERTGPDYCCRAIAGTERQIAHKTGRSGEEAIAACLSQAGLRRDEVQVGLLLNPSLFFTRGMEVPDVAMGALPQLLAQEILRRTPFSLSDIRHGATVAKAPTPPLRGVTKLRHWIIRRDLLETAFQDAGLNPETVDILFTRDDDDRDVAAVRLTASPTDDRPWPRRQLALAAGLALLCTVLALVAIDQTQESKVESLAAALTDMKAQIHGSNGVTDAVGLLTSKADIGTAAIVSELSKVMPDDTFLTELRIVDGKVEATGFSSDAARLVRLVDKSPLFKEAVLAGAIEPNVAEGKEHFSLKADLRTGQMLRLRAATVRPRSALAQESRP